MNLILFRKLPLLFAVLCCVCPIAAQAQFGVYGTVTGERIGGLTCAQPSTGIGSCNTGTTTEKPYGGDFGVYYDFRTLGPVRLGVDLRGGVLNTNKNTVNAVASTDNVRHYTALGGVRASFGTPIRLLRPYGEFAVGYARFGQVNPLLSYPLSNYTQAEGLVGIDVPVLPYLDIRAIEFGAGAVFGPSTHGIQSIGAGLVFHSAR